MIIFLDTSAWIKFFLQEEGTEEIKRFLLEQSQIEKNSRATSAVTYAEVHATLKRALKGRRISEVEYRQAFSEFEQQWEDFDIPDVDAHHIQHAGDLANIYGLKGCDAFQLASAQAIQAYIFVCSDEELYEAAKTEKLVVWNPVDGKYDEVKEESPENQPSDDKEQPENERS